MNETIPYLPGGVLLFAGIERRLGIAELLASRVTDERDPNVVLDGDVRHRVRDGPGNGAGCFEGARVEPS